MPRVDSLRAPSRDHLNTRVTNQIRTNTSGYISGPALFLGYEVMSKPWIQRSVRSGLVLSVGQHMDLDLTGK